MSLHCSEPISGFSPVLESRVFPTAAGCSLRLSLCSSLSARSRETPTTLRAFTLVLPPHLSGVNCGTVHLTTVSTQHLQCPGPPHSLSIFDLFHRKVCIYFIYLYSASLSPVRCNVYGSRDFSYTFISQEPKYKSRTEKLNICLLNESRNE